MEEVEGVGCTLGSGGLVIGSTGNVRAELFPCSLAGAWAVWSSWSLG